MTTFGQRLVEARKNAKLTQNEVKRRIGISQSMLSELENDDYEASGYVTQLAHLYKVSARWLAEGKGPRDISTLELTDDPEVLRVWHAYSGLDGSTRALVDYLFGPANAKRPIWMSPSAAAAIESTRQLVSEQMKSGGQGTPDIKK